MQQQCPPTQAVMRVAPWSLAGLQVDAEAWVGPGGLVFLLLLLLVFVDLGSQEWEDPAVFVAVRGLFGSDDVGQVGAQHCYALAAGVDADGVGGREQLLVAVEAGGVEHQVKLPWGQVMVHTGVRARPWASGTMSNTRPRYMVCAPRSSRASAMRSRLSWPKSGVKSMSSVS